MLAVLCQRKMHTGRRADMYGVQMHSGGKDCARVESGQADAAGVFGQADVTAEVWCILHAVLPACHH